MSSRFTFAVGDMVRIKSGPFLAFTGRVQEVDDDNGRLKVRVSIFGREEPIELRFLEVEKLTFGKEGT
jgi:transcription termination/antitermination protein NusG